MGSLVKLCMAKESEEDALQTAWDSATPEVQDFIMKGLEAFSEDHEFFKQFMTSENLKEFYREKYHLGNPPNIDEQKALAETYVECSCPRCQSTLTASACYAGFDPNEKCIMRKSHFHESCKCGYRSTKDFPLTPI
jgi:hypothetical protein